MNAPSTMPNILSGIFFLPRNTPPISRDARAMVTIPVPISMLTDLCDWASRQPDSAVNEFATQSPIIVVNAGLTDEERTISGLSPVALIASPRRVFRKSPSITATAATAIIATKSFDCLATGVPLRSAAILVNTVSVLFILSIDEPLMTAIFIE